LAVLFPIESAEAEGNFRGVRHQLSFRGYPACQTLGMPDILE